MNKLTFEQRKQIIQIYFENQSSIRQTYIRLRAFYGAHNRPTEQAIRRTVDRFRKTYSLSDAITPTRKKNVRTENNIAAVNKSVNEEPNLPIRRRSQALGLCLSTTWKILRKDLGLQPYNNSKIYLHLNIMADTDRKRGRPSKAEKELAGKKRGRPAAAVEASPPKEKKVEKDNSNGDVPVKRGRGRPPKGEKKAAIKSKTIASSGRGRGRPPKAAKKSEPEESEDEEDTKDENDDDDTENGEGEDDSSS